MEKKTQIGLTYYQPEIYIDDGTNIGWVMPSELHSFQVFTDKDDLEEYMEGLGYEKGDYVVREYHDYDIDGITVLDGNGDVVEIYDEAPEA